MRLRTIVQLAVGCALAFGTLETAKTATVQPGSLQPGRASLDERCRRAAIEQLPPYPWPLKPFARQHPVRGYFGDPRTVIDGSDRGTFSFHNGVDIAGWPGNRVYAVVSGHVLSRGGDEIIVRSPHGRRFQYIHVRPRVRLGQYVGASRTILGYLMPRWHHVHLAEIRRGCAVNPLAPGHLQPYLDRTRPSVVSITFVAPGGARLAPGRLRGEVEMISQAFDEPARSQAATASGSSPATWTLAGCGTVATRSLSLPPTPPATAARRRRRSAYRTAAASESSHPRTTGAAPNAPSRAESGNPPSRGSLVQLRIVV